MEVTPGVFLVEDLSTLSVFFSLYLVFSGVFLGMLFLPTKNEYTAILKTGTLIAIAVFNIAFSMFVIVPESIIGDYNRSVFVQHKYIVRIEDSSILRDVVTNYKVEMLDEEGIYILTDK